QFRGAASEEEQAKWGQGQQAGTYTAPEPATGRRQCHMVRSGLFSPPPPVAPFVRSVHIEESCPPQHGRTPFFGVHPNVGRRSDHRCGGCVFAGSSGALSASRSAAFERWGVRVLVW